MSTADRPPREPPLGPLDRQAEAFGLYGPQQEMPPRKAEPIRELRRAGGRTARPRLGMLWLVESDGVLRWQQRPPRAAGGRRAAAGRAAGRVVRRYRFEDLPPSAIGEFLAGMDARMNPQQGLRRYQDGVLRPVAGPPGQGPVLLLIHGFISSTDHLLAEIRRTRAGRSFLAWARRAYREILTFDHPTISVSPILNALDLRQAFRRYRGAIDVVCHSRGGLVTRWWWEGMEPGYRGVRRAVCVGSPLAGTSLAAAARIRRALDLLTNVAEALRLAGDAAAVALPLVGLVAGLMRVVASVTRLGAQTPLLDAAAAMVPGIAGMAREGSNRELGRLRTIRPLCPPQYFAVVSDFEPEPAGWKFWRHFTQAKQRTLDLGADLVFPGANDVIVDTDSMTELGDALRIAGPGSVLRYRPADHVNHFDYFSQPRTIRFLARKLRQPRA